MTPVTEDGPKDAAPAVSEKDRRFSGVGQRLDGKPIKVSASPALGPAKDPVVDEDEEDEMPWKKRIPKGVKLTSPPYTYGIGSGDQSRKCDKTTADAFSGAGQSLQ